ncbi:MAG: lysophospholipid acyltransferase family protein [Acidobacteria bacterium]|nr:lysophospholipid acyltransferase family protein [Acidobacteriota bacterium]
MTFRKQLVDFLGYMTVRWVVAFLGLLSHPWALAVAHGISDVVFFLDARHRRVALRNLELAFPHWDRRRRRKVARCSFRNMGRLVVEVSRFPRLRPSNIGQHVLYDDHQGLENILRPMREGRGILVLTGHIGPWELMPFAHALHGYPLSFVVRPLDNAYLDRFLDRRRCLSGNVTIPKRDSLKKILAALQRGEAVGFLVDQNSTPNEGVFVPFFGRSACTTTGLTRLALRTGAAVIPAYILKEPDREQYRIVVQPEVPLVRSGHKERDVVENTARFTRILEEIIRQHPECWLWGHRRWKTRPPEDPDPVY